jgi:hypothetical protein
MKSKALLPSNSDGKGPNRWQTVGDVATAAGAPDDVRSYRHHDDHDDDSDGGLDEAVIAASTLSPSQLADAACETELLNEEGANRGPTFPDVEVELTGTDGNVFMLAGLVTKEMKRAGVGKSYIDDLRNKVFECGSYEEALVLLGETVTIS